MINRSKSFAAASETRILNLWVQPSDWNLSHRNVWNTLRFSILDLTLPVRGTSIADVVATTNE
jgi:hypothetical protein